MVGGPIEDTHRPRKAVERQEDQPVEGNHFPTTIDLFLWFPLFLQQKEIALKNLHVAYYSKVISEQSLEFSLANQLHFLLNHHY